MTTFNEFVVKVHSRCNLACDYCYVYESPDQSWREQPRVMTEETFADVCRRIAAHRDGPVSLIFHGGEPLLAGAARIERFAALAREIIGPVLLRLQTNGTLVTAGFAAACARQGIRVAVSLDGGRAANDKHRGQSYSRVRNGIALLNAERDVFAGLLCVVDTSNDPVETYAALLAHEPPSVDFLLPHANWVTPPPRPGSYGDWLVAVFERWYRAPVRETRVRLFDDIVTLVLGGSVTSETVGLAPVRVAVFETDGSLEQVDALKTAYPGAASLPVKDLEAALREPGVVARQIGVAALAPECLRCPVRDVCGGGNYVHRYHPARGFRAPSVYCDDLLKLVTHITAAVRADVARLSSAR
ncbi:FxsB family cyclophane-forming radical SAM/SPASM peptide maturase [Actinoplanes sp. CA-142083]|uniref:FxsB family cyclophane-forming radical SAM/SPASM peptide maturase n=1 Tax=Actinoplanes sp. CA-142083 TaxID=3239903 RepID=UPI003D91E12F